MNLATRRVSFVSELVTDSQIPSTVPRQPTFLMIGGEEEEKEEDDGVSDEE